MSEFFRCTLFFRPFELKTLKKPRWAVMPKEVLNLIFSCVWFCCPHGVCVFPHGKGAGSGILLALDVGLAYSWGEVGDGCHKDDAPDDDACK